MLLEFLDTAPLVSKLSEDFWDFCFEKKVSDKNIPKVFEQTVSELACNLGLEVKIKPKRPFGIDVMFSEIKKYGEPLVVV